MKAAAALIAAYIALATLWSVVTPIYEAPDEKGHAEYVAHLATQRTLPVQSTTPRNYAHHPPLYYAAAALASAGSDWDDERDMPIWLGPGHGTAWARHRTAETFPWRGRTAAIHIARLVSVLMGAAAVAFTIAAGRIAFAEKPEVGLLAGALLAFTPQFTFISGAASNDSTAAAASAAALWALLRVRRAPERVSGWLLLGAACGTALLAKATTLSVVALAAFAWLLSRRSFESFGRWLLSGAALSGVCALSAGWWFVRNAALYGDIFGWTAYQAAWPHMIRSELPTIAELGALADLQWRSYWGKFGWMTVPAGEWLTIGAGGLAAAAVWGWVRGRVRGVPVLVGLVVVHEAYLIGQNLLQTAVMAQGRHFLPAGGAAMILAAAGLLATATERGERRARAMGWAAAAAAANLACALLIVGPAYDGAALPKTTLLNMPRRIDARIGQSLLLRGYALRMRVNEEKATLRARLYWQARGAPERDYAVFVDALDESGEMLGRRYIVPGERANQRPTAWTNGDLIADDWEMSMPKSDLRRVVRLRIGAYDARTGVVLTPIQPAAGDGGAGRARWRVAGVDSNYILVEIRPN